MYEHNNKTKELIENLNIVLKDRGIELIQLTPVPYTWGIYDNKTKLIYGHFYITDKGRYEFSLIPSYTKETKVLLHRIKKDIANVISTTDTYDCYEEAC